MLKQRGSESRKEAAISRGMDGLEKSETKVEDRGESERSSCRD